jgi:hypothetical protein
VPWKRAAHVMSPLLTLTDWTMRSASDMPIVGLLATLLLVGLSGPTAHAQRAPKQQAPNQTYQQSPSGAPSPSAPAGTGVPDWAEPERPSQNQTNPTVGRAATDSPTMPSNPKRTPIGGLGWLVAAGLGYGSYRLAQE